MIEQIRYKSIYGMFFMLCYCTTIAFSITFGCISIGGIDNIRTLLEENTTNIAQCYQNIYSIGNMCLGNLIAIIINIAFFLIMLSIVDIKQYNSASFIEEVEMQ